MKDCVRNLGINKLCHACFSANFVCQEMIIDGKQLPVGTIVDVQIYNLHHNPTVWDEPMVSQYRLLIY